ncbi:MAG: hypothetical protein JXJ17_10910 [Anaerolineae bacterium]|nr:hypothetical protein [Anaerolineae bacterium]
MSGTGRAWKPLQIGLALLIIAVTAGCSHVEDLPYETICDRDALADLHGSELVLIRFDPEGVLMRAELVDEELATTIGEEHKTAFIEAMAEHFDIVDMTDEDIVPEGDIPSPDDLESIQAILDELGADGAVLVLNGYGYEMNQGGAILDEAAEDAAQDTLETILGEKAGDHLQSLTGPTFVSNYYLASDTMIVNRQGEVVWEFNGKAGLMPRPLSGSVGEEAETFARTMVGGDPTEGELTRAISLLYEHYSAYLSWILDRELEESSAINYFVDYPNNQEKDGITVFPASDSIHTPFIMTAEERAEYEERKENNLWTVAKSSRWRTFWQWPQAWAALKLLGLSLLVALPISYLGNRAQERGQEPPGCVLVVGFVAGIAMLASIFFLLKAVF